ncbi:MAG: TetR family transcriptional regulator [Planctomycetota bacterium]|nr:MAG: TetR family transcriptional regulator [Planctomycetota bacterium]
MPSPMFERLEPEKRRRVLEAAARVFAAKGLDGANIRDLSAACGVSRGSLYDYFHDKQDLLATCARVALREMAEIHEQALAGGGGFFATLERIFLAGAEYIEQHPHYALLYLQVAGRGEAILPPELHRQTEARAAEQYRAMIRAGIAAGELRPDTPVNHWAFAIDSMWTAYVTCLASPHLHVRLQAYFELEPGASPVRLRAAVHEGLRRFLLELRRAIGQPNASS